MTKHLCTLLLIFLCLNTYAKNELPAPTRPHDFAYGIAISTEPGNILYQVLLPTAVYQGVVRDDLGDIRIFNTKGESVPYAIRSLSAPQEPIEEKNLTLFPVYGGTNTGMDGMSLHVERNTQGAILQVTTNDQTQAPQQHVIAYLLDASEIDTPIQTLKLTLPPNNESFIRSVDIEYSNDLKHWQIAVQNAPIANLREHDNTLEQNEIPINNIRAKYFRILWPKNDSTLALSQVTAELTPKISPPEHAWITLPGKPDKKDSNAWIFDTDGHMPIDLARITFPEKNTAVQVQLFSRHSPEDAWKYRREGLVYQLEEHGRERVSPDFKLTTRTDQYWQLRTQDQENKSDKVPTLSLGWHPQALIFIAQGEGPYMLVYGNPSAKPTKFEVNQMIDRLQKEEHEKLHIGTTVLGEQQILGGEHALKAPMNWKKWMLWSVLILGVLLLIGMVVRLFRQLGEQEK